MLTVEPAFNGLRQPNAPIQRLWTGALWSEGPAWNAQGRYLVWSDIPNNRQLRWIEDDGHVSVFRTPSNNSNGNTFDFQGRQLSCEHLTRRVVRYELDGSVSVIAGMFNGKRLNSPNDVVPHPDGSYWFTDPPYGGPALRGHGRTRRAGPRNTAGRLNPKLGQPLELGSYKRELPTAVYRVDKSGTLTQVAGEDLVPDPERALLLARLQEALRGQHRQGPRRHRTRAARATCTSSTSARTTSSATASSSATSWSTASSAGPTACAPTWTATSGCSSNAGRAVGYSGVTVWTPQGKLIGRIRLPEVCGNVCFGGPKRNRLFMAASQSLYAVYTATQGAAPG